MRNIIFILILVLSCKQDKNIENKKRTIKEYFPDSEQNVEYEYRIVNGDTILNGRSISTNKNGKITAIGNYDNGKLRGDFTSFYDNGKIEFKKFIINDEETGQSVFYYENGNIEKYVLYNRKNEVAFILDFDEKGNYEKHLGYVFADWFYSNENLSNLKVGDTIKYGFIIPNIPDAKKTFNVRLLDYEDDHKIIREIKNIEPVGILIKEKVLKEGKNTFRGKLKLEFNDMKRTIIEDSLELTFEIRK